MVQLGASFLYIVVALLLGRRQTRPSQIILSRRRKKTWQIGRRRTIIGARYSKKYFALPLGRGGADFFKSTRTILVHQYNRMIKSSCKQIIMTGQIVRIISRYIRIFQYWSFVFFLMVPPLVSRHYGASRPKCQAFLAVCPTHWRNAILTA